MAEDMVDCVSGSPAFVAELKIPVPWGHIAARAHGDPCSHPVLAVHGLQDNAGSFDRLLPLLSSPLYVVCVDLPGHGLSSPFPPGLPLDFIDHVTALLRVLNHLGWSRCCYLGHSLGGQLGVFLAALYPERVSKLIVLDAVVPLSFHARDYLKRHRLLTAALFALENTTQPPPAYTWDEALHRLVAKRPSKLTEEGARALLSRAVTRGPDGGYSFTADRRLKVMLWPLLDSEQLGEVVKRIRCPFLLVLTSYMEGFKELEAFKAPFELLVSKPNVTYVSVDGGHDVHNNHPERVVPHIESFLQAQHSQL